MTIKGIISKRKLNPQTYWQIVYEWEDVFAEILESPLLDMKKGVNDVFRNYIIRNWFSLLNYLYLPLFKITRSSVPNNGLYLYFQMNINNALHFSPFKKRKLVPYIIDSFFTEKDLPAIYRKYRYCPLVLISSLEVYNYLKSKNCPLNLHFLPLSLSDRYRNKENVRYKKKYDAVAAGRPNPELHFYMEQYVKENPSFEYISCRIVPNNNNDNIYEYYSNKKGKINVDFSSRESYLQFLKDGKISFYTTPGVSDANKTKGFNPVTPRYLEMLSCQNQIVAIYPDTEETRYFGLDKICPSINSYTEFKSRIEKYMHEEADIELYGQILDKHYTSQCAYELKNLFKN